jgi:hypothetical protein
MGSESMTHVHSHRTLAERSVVLRHQNDNARRYARAGLMYVTSGVIALGAAQMAAAVRAIRDFDGFNADNDPHDEHDMGIVTVNGDVVLWKIDYYDLDRRGGSPDPVDPNVTTRVLTIMLASEY